MSRPTRKWRLNLRALAALAAATALIALVPLIAGLARGRAGGRSPMLAEARDLVEAGKPDLALHFLAEHLRRDPDDAEALDLQAGLLADSARTPETLQGAIAAADQVLRRGGAPAKGGAQAARRRLVGLYLRLGDFAPALVQYRTAEEVGRRLVDESAGDDRPGDLRLLARVQAGLAAKENDREALARAIDNFEKARALDPRDVDGAERLARVYRDQADQPAKAARVLGELEAANRSAAAYLAAYRHYSGGAGAAASGAGREAAEALRKAEALAPDDPEVVVASVEDAQRRGDAAEARRRLDRLPEAVRDQPRVRFLRGLVEVTEGRLEQGIRTWRESLVASGGNDLALTWQMAFVLLRMGRVDEAAPLVGQFRRLSGGSEPAPAWRILAALEELKRRRPAQAVGHLEAARKKAPGLLPHQVALLTGEAHEAMRDEAQATEDYRRAVKAAPKWSAARLALVRLLRPRRPEEAAAELRLGLVEAPDDPALLLALARDELQAQLRRIRQRKPADWDAFRAALGRARAAAPADPGVALVEAESLAADGRADEALAVLERATRLSKANAELWMARARLMAGRGDLDGAEMVLDQAAAPEAAGDQAALRILRAQIKTRRGHGREAREELVRDLDRLPPEQRPAIWKELGDLYAGQNDRAEARRAYGQWADLLPDDPVPRLYLLDLAVAVGDEEGVEEGIRQLRGEAGRGGGGRKYDVGNLYYRIATAMDLLRGRPGETPEALAPRLERAKEIIDTIRADAPDRRFAYDLEGRYWERRALAEPEGPRREEFEREAVDAYERSLEREGGPWAVQRLVDLLTRLKRFDDLKRLSRAHGETFPDLDRRAAEVAAALGDKEQATRLAEQVYALSPDNLDAAVFLARVLNIVGEAGKAERALKAMTERHRGEIQPWLALLVFYAERGDFASARATADAIRANVKRMAKDEKDDRPEFVYALCYWKANRPAEAMALYDEALAKWPDDPRIARGAAEFYGAAGRPDKAQKCLEATYRRDPSQRWAARELALIASADARTWPRAEEYLGPPTAADAPEDRLTRAVVLARGGKPEQRKQAIEALEGLVGDLPAGLATAARARAALGQLYAADGRPAKAAELARDDATAPGAGPAAVAAYAEALIRAESWDEASAQVDRLAKLMPAGSLAAPKLRARMLAARDDPAGAAEALERAAREARDAPGGAGASAARDVVQTLLKMGLADAAERVARDLAARSPGDSWLLGDVLALAGRRGEALDCYRAAAGTDDPAAAREAAHKAVALATSGRRDPDEMDRAGAIVEAARRRAPGAVDLIARAAYLRHFQGRYDDEIRLYGEIAKAAPDDLSHLNNLAWTLSEGLKRPDDALKQINTLLDRLGNEPPQCLDTRGVIQVRLRKYPEAIRDLQAAVKGNPNPVYYAHLALAYREAGRDEEFRGARDAALKAGLKPEQFDPAERQELGKLIFPQP